MIWLILVLALGFAVLAWRRLDWALMLTIALLPSYLIRFKIGGLPSTWLEVMILVEALVWLVKNWGNLFAALKHNWRAKRVAKPYPWSAEIIALLVISIIALAISHFAWSALGVWRAYFLEPLLFYLLVINVIGRENALDKIVWPLSWSALAVSAVAWYQKFVDLKFLNPVWSLEGRATSVFDYANAVGLYLAPIIMLLVGWLLAEEHRSAIKNKAWRLIYVFAAIIAALAAIVFAKSVGALIGLAVALIIFGVLANKKTAVITVALALCVGLTVYLTPQFKLYVGDRLAFKNLSGEIRKLQWKETFIMLKQDGRWFWGVGLDAYQAAVAPFHQPGLFFNRDRDPNFHYNTVVSAEYRKTHWQPVEIYMYPHNILLNFWSELGLLGLLLFVWLFVKYWWLGLKLWRRFSVKTGERYIVLGLTTALIAIAVHGWVDVPYFKNDLAVLFWLFFAMMGLVNLWHKNKIKKNI
jgi:O-antigen ligase